MVRTSSKKMIEASVCASKKMMVCQSSRRTSSKKMIEASVFSTQTSSKKMIEASV